MLRWCSRSILLGLLAFSAAPSAQAGSPYALDPTFGTNGIVVTHFGAAIDPIFGPYGSYATDIAVLPSGRIVAVGIQIVGTVKPLHTDAHVVALYAPDGHLDPSFAGTGFIVRDALSDGNLSAVLPSGSDAFTWATGESLDPAYPGTHLYRYGTSGVLDTTFGVDGALSFYPPASTLGVLSVARDFSGRVLLAGGRHPQGVDDGTFHAAIARLTASGLPDGTFGQGGTAELVPPDAQPLDFDRALLVVPQADGKIVAVGSSVRNGVTTMLFVRLNADGSVDATYGGGGYVRFNPGRDAQLLSAAVDVDGSLTAAGWIRSGTDVVNPLLVRLTPGGVLDPHFGVAGMVTDPSLNAAYHDIALQGDGWIVVARTTYRFFPAGITSAALLRYTATGTLDPVFGKAGVVDIPGLLSARALAQQSDGNWLIAGIAPEIVLVPPYSTPTTYEQFAIARVLAGALPAVEFHHAGFDHYFVTTDPMEMADLDAGIHPGWARTGLSFNVYGGADTAPVDASAVCRFYIPPQHGDSHFFSGDRDECARVVALTTSDPNYSGYVLETPRAFFTRMPDRGSGACANGGVAVYRLWNQRSDSNHRYTTDRSVRDAMVMQGWLPEGYGPDAVALCASP